MSPPPVLAPSRALAEAAHDAHGGHGLHEWLLIGFAAFAALSALYVFLRYQLSHLRRRRGT